MGISTWTNAAKFQVISIIAYSTKIESQLTIAYIMRVVSRKDILGGLER